MKILVTKFKPNPPQRVHAKNPVKTNKAPWAKLGKRLIP